MQQRKLRMGMIGGGAGAFIGAVHRMAATMDGQIELVAGAFSSDPERSKASGEQLYLNPNRVYASYHEMLEKEAALPPDQRIDFVGIVTPNHMHYPQAKAALEAGFHVVCDKPMTTSLEEAKDLVEVVKKSGKLFCLTHNYTGYPMVKQAKAMIAAGAIGQVRKVVVEYPQGWLATHLEASGQKQASWRTDPKQSGASNCMGDIGTHAENLAEYITGMQIDTLCADISTLVPGRVLDDDGNVLLRFANGARGILYASQIAVGEENNLRIRVYGETGGLEWHQQEPNTLLVKHLEGPTQIYRTGGNHGYLHPSAQANTRLPAGHPEGYIEAFANIYVNFAKAVRQYQATGQLPTELDFPTVTDGVRGVAFIASVLASSQGEAKWTKFQD